MAPRLGYHASLDGLRAIAVLLVAGFHFAYPGFHGGFLGVDIFFVLSGFLITRLLLDEHAATATLRLGRFYGRRALRLLPAFILLLAVCGAFVPPMWVVAAISYVGNWFLALHRLPVSPISHTWSLAIEEQFYLVWPLLLLAMLRARMSRERIAMVAIALAGASLLQKVVLCIDHDPGTWMRIYFATDTRADALLIGCAFALLSPRIPGAVAAVAAVVLGYFVVSARIGDLDLFRHGGLTLVAISTAIIVTWLVARAETPVLEARPLVALGKISYGIYLWHHPVMWLAVPGAAKLPLSIAAAAASYYLVERRALVFKRRLA